MLFQLLQSLNLMDYSLLVGIHDSTIPAGEMSDFEDFSDDESGEEYTDLPLSPNNTGELAFEYCRNWLLTLGACARVTVVVLCVCLSVCLLPR